MAANPEMEGIVALPGLEAPSSEEPAVPAVRVRRAKPRWLSTALVGGVALIATGSLGYVSYSAAQQRNAAYDAFVGTRATLVATDNTLTLAQADAASKKVTANYAAVYVLDQGKVQLDYQNVQACNSYGACRTASQDLLNDLQKFQADRSRAIGAWSGHGGIAAAVGPFLGGWLISAVSWRLVFFINLPLAVVVVLIAHDAVIRRGGELARPVVGEPRGHDDAGHRAGRENRPLRRSRDTS